MSSSGNVISIKILDRSYKVKCPPEEAQSLQEAARYVDQQMRKLRQSSHISNAEHIAVVTALNISHEMLSLKKNNSHQINNVEQRMRDLQLRIQNTLAQEEEFVV